MIKYTIGLPVIKSKFLVITLDSILNQTYKGYKVIIKNNASNVDEKNNINEICKSYINLSNFEYFESEKKLDISSNFNSILDKVTTDFFMILSDDDILNPDFLKNIDKLILKYNNVNLFHCRVEIIDEYGKLSSITPICPEFETEFDFIYSRLIGVRYQFLSDFVVRSNLLKDVGGFQILNSGWGLDDITWFKLSSSGVAYTNYLGLKYRSSNSNFTSEIYNFNERVMDILLICNLAKSKLYENKFIIKLPNYIIENAIKKFRNRSIEYLLIKKYFHVGFFKLICIYFFNHKKLKITFSNLVKAILKSKKIKL